MLWGFPLPLSRVDFKVTCRSLVHEYVSEDLRFSDGCATVLKQSPYGFTTVARITRPRTMVDDNPRYGLAQFITKVLAASTCYRRDLFIPLLNRSLATERISLVLTPISVLKCCSEPQTRTCGSFWFLL